MERATVASGGVIRTKDGSYHSVKNGAIESVVETQCSGTRHSGGTRHSSSVAHTAEDD